MQIREICSHSKNKFLKKYPDKKENIQPDLSRTDSSFSSRIQDVYSPEIQSKSAWSIEK